MGGFEALRSAFEGSSVLLTGHTGFKGSWLSLWLAKLGARVTGLSLPADASGLFEAAAVREVLAGHFEADIRDFASVQRALAASKPDFVFHLAAQSLVRASYDQPLETFATNSQGTVNVLEAVRLGNPAGRACSVVCVTTDKCYRNDETGEPMREDDALGGHDPYSASKASAELAVQSYRSSFFASDRIAEHGVRLASARAGNVLGGGDFAVDRIVPDMVRARAAGEPLVVRNPDSVRPWQHVLDPLHGYLQLAAALAGESAGTHCTAFNFGPDESGCTTVGALIEAMQAAFGDGSPRIVQPAASQAQGGQAAPHEAKLLRLATDRAKNALGWRPSWNFAATAQHTAGWYARVAAEPSAARAACEHDLDQFLIAASR